MTGITGQSVDARVRPVFQGQTLLAIGFNPDIDTGTVPEDVWPVGGLIDFATTAGPVSVVSDSVDDTAAGTGAQSLLLNGVDENFAEISEVVVLNGLTPVLTVADFLHVQISTVLTVGSGGVNAGVITFTIDGGVVNGIVVGKSQTQSAARVIPASVKPGTVAHLINTFAVAGKQQTSVATVSLVSTLATGVIISSLDIPVTSAGGPFTLDIHTPVTFTVGSKTVVRVSEVSANSTLVSAVLQFAWL